MNAEFSLVPTLRVTILPERSTQIVEEPHSSAKHANQNPRLRQPIRPPPSVLRPASVGFVRHLVKSRRNAKVQPNIKMRLMLCSDGVVIDLGFVRSISTLTKVPGSRPRVCGWVRFAKPLATGFVSRKPPPLGSFRKTARRWVRFVKRSARGFVRQLVKCPVVAGIHLNINS